MPEKSYMYLTIAGDFEPEDVVSRISMTPWQQYKKHSKSIENMIPRVSRVNYGLVETTDMDPDVYEMSQDLYSQLAPHKDELIALSKDSSLQFCCSTCLWMIHDLEVSTPPIGFSAEVVEFLGLIQASIDVDLYRDDEYNIKTDQSKSLETNKTG